MKTLFTTLTGIALLGLSSCACAAIVSDLDANGDPIVGGVNGVDAGFVDRLVAEGLMGDNSNPDTETAWVNEQINLATQLDLEYEIKTEDIVYYSTDEANVFAFELFDEPAPSYFLIKNAQGLALFENTASLYWGVFDMALLSEAMNLGDFTISHVTEFSGGGDRDISQVPIPASVYLMGTGLLGLVGVARRNPKV